MKTITKIGVVGGLLAALGCGCDRTVEQNRGTCETDARSGLVICSPVKTSLEDVRGFYHESLPGTATNTYSISAVDKEARTSEIVLVNSLRENVYQHGWFECPAGCKVEVGEDGSVYIKLGGQ